MINFSTELLNCNDDSINLSDLSMGRKIVIQSHADFGTEKYPNGVACNFKIEVKLKYFVFNLLIVSDIIVVNVNREAISAKRWKFHVQF